MKRLFGIVVVNLLLLGAAAFAQQTDVAGKRTPEAAIIKAAAEDSSHAFETGDFGKVIDSTYPKLIEMGGGREKVMIAMEGQFKEMRDSGMKIVAHTVGEPEPSVRAGTKLVAIVPTALKMEMRESIIEQKSFWLAVSTDEGKSWRFLDGSSLDADALKLLLPEAVGKIKLPKVSQNLTERKPAN
jgi:hypothetical protein